MNMIPLTKTLKPGRVPPKCSPVLAATVSAALLLSACAPSPQHAEGTAATSPGAAVPSLQEDHGSDSGLEGPTASPTPVKVPAFDAAEKTKTQRLAARAARAFVDTAVSPEIWRQNLAQVLSPDARALYSTASNQSLPYGKVTKVGPAVQDPKYPMFVEVKASVEGGALTIKMKYTDDYTGIEVYKILPAQG